MGFINKFSDHNLYIHINIQTRSLSSYKVVQHNLSLSCAINPWFVTGFVDGEGYFSISILRDNVRKIGWRGQLWFSITLHKKDKTLLVAIKNYFGIGYITEHKDSLLFRASTKEDLIVIINHFNKYNLITKKRADFEFWKKAFFIIKYKNHLTMEGLEKLVGIKSSLNWGLSAEIESAFPKITPVDRCLVKNKKIHDTYWLAGFTSAEGCVAVSVRKFITHKLNEKLELIFQVTQHTRDEALLTSFIKYLDCGRISKSGKAIDYQVSRFSDLENKIIPFFKKYKILGEKSKDFNDFCDVL